MKRLQILMGFVVALTCSSLNAQTNMTAKIPFDFQLGPSAMPAGDYRIDYSPGKLILRSKTGNHSVIVLTNAVTRWKAPEKGVLEFNRYGNEYFFSAIWMPNSAQGNMATKTAREKELVSRAEKPEPTKVALGR